MKAKRVGFVLLLVIIFAMYYVAGVWLILLIPGPGLEACAPNSQL